MTVDAKPPVVLTSIQSHHIQTYLTPMLKNLDSCLFSALVVLSFFPLPFFSAAVGSSVSFSPLPPPPLESNFNTGGG